MFVCLSVCLSVRPSARVTGKPHAETLTIFFCMLPVAMAQSSSGGVAMHYVLPVLRMTSCFHAIKQEAMFRTIRQVAVPVVRQTTAVFG